MRKSTVLAALLLLAPAVSQAKSLEDLLVEKGVITKGEAKGTSGGASKVYWSDGTRVGFPDAGYVFGINTLIKSRYTYSDNDATPNTSSFDINQAKVIVSGSALHEEFEYELRTNLVGGTGADGSKSPQLEDANLTWKACDASKIKFGQFKTAVGRQFNAQDQGLMFADASDSSAMFNLGRQAGIHAGYAVGDSVNVGVGIFNGSSTGEGINRSGVDTKHTGVLDVRADVMGKMDPSVEGDIGRTKDMALNVGGAYAYGEATTVAGKTRNHNLSVDANLKSDGLGVNAEIFWKRTTFPDGGEKQRPLGFYVQAGYFVDDNVEVAARYGLVDADGGRAITGVDKRNEATAGVNYYWWNNNLKAQLNYSLLNTKALGDGEDVNDNRWVLQLVGYL